MCVYEFPVEECQVWPVSQFNLSLILSLTMSMRKEEWATLALGQGETETTRETINVFALRASVLSNF